MTITYPIIKFGNDLEAKPNSTFDFGAADMQSFSRPEDLRDDLVFEKYATFETNYWLLDGSFKLMSEVEADVHVGFMGGVMTDSNPAGGYVHGEDYQIEIILDEPVNDFRKMLINFGISGVYPITMKIELYDSSDVLLSDDWDIGIFGELNPLNPDLGTFEDNILYAIWDAFGLYDDVKRIVIDFSNGNPALSEGSRYLRVVQVEINDVTIFKGETIKSGKIIEEVNPLSTEITINTLEFEIFSEDAELSIVDPTVVTLKAGQALDVYENVDGINLYMGRFYVDDWENTAETLMKFYCHDAIGVIEKQKAEFVGDLWWEEESHPSIMSQDIIEDIMTAAGIEYSLDPALEDIELNGWLPITNVRDALQQVCFIIGATVTCARSSVVNIVPFVNASEEVEEFTFTSANKGTRQKLVLKELISRVEVHEHFYNLVVSDKPIFSGPAVAGQTYRIISYPIIALAWADSGTSSGTVLSYNVNYIEISISSSGSLIIEADSEYLISKIARFVEEDFSVDFPGSTPQTIIIDNVTMAMGSDSIVVEDIAQRVFDYHQQRYKKQARLYASEAYAGAVVLMSTLGGKNIRGMIERMEINLTGGFIQDVEIVGAIEDA